MGITHIFLPFINANIMVIFFFLLGIAIILVLPIYLSFELFAEVKTMIFNAKVSLYGIKIYEKPIEIEKKSKKSSIYLLKAVNLREINLVHRFPVSEVMNPTKCMAIAGLNELSQIGKNTKLDVQVIPTIVEENSVIQVVITTNLLKILIVFIKNKVKEWNKTKYKKS